MWSTYFFSPTRVSLPQREIRIKKIVDEYFPYLFSNIEQQEIFLRGGSRFLESPVVHGETCNIRSPLTSTFFFGQFKKDEALTFFLSTSLAQFKRGLCVEHHIQQLPYAHIQQRNIQRHHDHRNRAHRNKYFWVVPRRDNRCIAGPEGGRRFAGRRPPHVWCCRPTRLLTRRQEQQPYGIQSMDSVGQN